MVAHAWDDALGGRDVDDLLMAQFCKAFWHKHRRDITQDPKSYSKMARAVTKMRERLTVSADASEELEDLMGDIDFKYDAQIYMYVEVSPIREIVLAHGSFLSRVTSVPVVAEIISWFLNDQFLNEQFLTRQSKPRTNGLYFL